MFRSLFNRERILPLIVLTPLCASALPGCAPDPLVATATSEIIIDVEPNISNAAWRLTGPENYESEGFGDRSFANLSPGNYVITWQPSPGRSTPNPSKDTQRLEFGTSVRFSARYDLEGFVYIAPGTFIMGSPTSEPQRASNETQHTVTLTRGFYMSQYEVTEQWWAEVMGGTPTTSQLPKVNVTWDLAVQFCNALSVREGLTPAYTILGTNGNATWNRNANGYRLPTEAEWEYACRAGTTTAFHNGTNCLSSDTEANYDGISPLTGCPSGTYRGARTNVGSFPANAWGLHDMHGNVWEWVWDGFKSDYQNLQGPNPVHDVGSGSFRVFRGGGWFSDAQDCRSADRNAYSPDYSNNFYGFRPVRSAF